MEKKNITIIVLVVMLVISGIGITFLVLNIPKPGITSYTTFRVGVVIGPTVIDPINSSDSPSNDVIAQVAETLFWYNITDPALPLEPLLAESYVWTTNKTIEITIRSQDHEYIYFHDGSNLTAEVVKWNLDRINYFINATGTLEPPTIPVFLASIYFLPDGRSIINKTEILSEMVVKVTLNDVFASFVPLLSHTGSAMISMKSHSNTTHIDLTTEKLVGTGPFVYDYYIPDVEVQFHRFDRYWRTNPYFEILVFEIISYTADRCQAMLEHTVDMIFGFDCWNYLCGWEQGFNDDPLITVKELGPNLIYWYMAFDNYRINTTWREAISKAVNYAYIINEIRQGNAVRGPPCVPSGMPGHNSSVTVAQHDIPEARSIMQSMGFGVGWDVGSQIGSNFTSGAHEVNWSDATFFTDAFGHPLDVNYHSGSGFNRDLNDLLNYDLDKIGIETIETTRTWEEFENDGENGLLRGIWYAGFAPYYNDAFTLFDPLFNPDSLLNYCNLTDPQVLAWLAAAAVETNITKRYELFGKLQYRLFEVLYAHIPLMASKTYLVHGTDIQGIPYNQLNIFLAWPLYRESA